ncbi:MAG: hypothetical protein A2X18_03935 [Bacteroidetes bacterium GWF2_40_14]|nr:MAG: hypothetical protein A2X18_03935 [Bacteroidetes bacterium GWF2_40_14]
MNQTFTIYSLFFLVTALVSFFGAFLAWHRRRVKGALEITWLMIASGIGAFCVIFETSAPTMAEKIFWAKMEFTGGSFTPVLYLIFVLRFTGKERFLSLKNIILLFIMPLTTLVVVLTNDYHNLMWSGFSPISPKTNLMEYYHGIWFWIGYLAYSYLMLIIATVSIFSFIFHHKNSFQYHGWIILLGGLVPWSASLFYLTGINVTPGLDLAPASITLSGLLLIYAIFHNRFLDLVPVARETLFETLQDGIIALDEHNRILDINKSAMTYLGIKNKSILGLFAEESGVTVPLLLKAVITVNNNDQIEVPVGTELKTFQLITQAIKNQSGSRIIVIRDISYNVSQQKELIKAKEKAEESDRLKSAFLANISHEIRTPMNGILGFTELLRELKLSEDEQQEYLAIIEKSGTRMLNIINDIISLSSLEAGLSKVKITNFDINDQMGIIFNLYEPQALEKGIKLIICDNIPTEEAKIISDKEKIKEILSNLIKNAIKFTATGSIEIGFSKNSDGLEFFVKDTGIGINPEQKELIFERFRQGSESVARYYEGAGLGLSISKAYVLLLGGRIWVESEEGKGSTFYFTIPC